MGVQWIPLVGLAGEIRGGVLSVPPTTVIT
jgi:hypothetical protein